MPIRFLRRIGWPFRSGGDQETDYEQLGHEPGGLPAEYAKIVEAEMRRMGIPESLASVQITQVALTPRDEACMRPTYAFWSGRKVRRFVCCSGCPSWNAASERGCKRTGCSK